MNRSQTSGDFNPGSLTCVRAGENQSFCLGLSSSPEKNLRVELDSLLSPFSSKIPILYQLLCELFLFKNDIMYQTLMLWNKKLLFFQESFNPYNGASDWNEDGYKTEPKMEFHSNRNGSQLSQQLPAEPCKHHGKPGMHWKGHEAL